MDSITNILHCDKYKKEAKKTYLNNKKLHPFITTAKVCEPTTIAIMVDITQ